MITLSELGWSAARAAELAALGHPEWQPARVSAEHRGTVDLLGPMGPQTLPTRDAHVGDWVAVSDRIEAVLARESALVRQAAKRATEAQVLAANLDVVFVVTSMNRDFNPRRMERYLAVVLASGARPVFVLNKADLDLGNHRRYVAQLPEGVPVVIASALIELGIEELREHLGGGTAALVGSSGVGKSSLINALLGRDALDTGGIRADDDTGKHTTTRRELLVVPGGVVIDTPGLRELQVWEADVDAVFADILELAKQCRYRDCAHESEPDCAVREGASPGRIANWRKLQREVAYHQGRKQEWELREERRRFARMVRRVQADKRKN